MMIWGQITIDLKECQLQGLGCCFGLSSSAKVDICCSKSLMHLPRQVSACQGIVHLPSGQEGKRKSLGSEYSLLGDVVGRMLCFMETSSQNEAFCSHLPAS